MAWTKSKTAVVAGACVLLAAGTAFIASHHEGKSMRSIRSEWTVISGDSGAWSFERGEIKAHSTTGDSILASSNKYGDVTFSAVAGSPDLAASLAIRLQDANNGYLIVFAPANTRVNPNGYILLAKRTSGNQSAIAIYKKQKVLTVGHSAKIKVVARGSAIEVFLNGTKVMQAEDTTFATGYIGLRICGYSSSYPCDATFSHVNCY
jgi:fructan beta-fructosidase